MLSLTAIFRSLTLFSEMEGLPGSWCFMSLSGLTPAATKKRAAPKSGSCEN
jgi:hypothetical protein